MVLRADPDGDEHDDQVVPRPAEVPLLASRSAIRLLTQLIFELLTFHVLGGETLRFPACSLRVRGSGGLERLKVLLEWL